MPKVSVIIPTYNREEYISDTIQSILNQTYKDFEIVVVDDGSTDNTKKQLEKFGSRIKVIEQNNSERAVSRNNGIKNSCGEFVAFVDSDDLWIENKLEKQVEIIENLHDVILVYGQALRIDSNNIKIKTARRQTKGYSGKVFEKLLLRNFIVSATPLIRREKFDKTFGFNSKYVPYEDWEFWLRFSLLGDFFFLQRPLAHYRIHPEQSVQLTGAEKIEEVTNMLLTDSFNLKKINSHMKNKSLGLAHLRYCYWYLLANQPDKANEKIKKAVKYNPAFLADPRWYGLMLLCKYPKLIGKGIFNLWQYH